ncbi:unnamed protein product [Schistocephalus solidus]|uniref:RGS domain-containing protein n=1 Tax=Schistocephalus solidus TaxID=70667 RepID=A0A183T7F8_SCHSO|nr:unnamed protein product [Schistocephalus solidus]
MVFQMEIQHHIGEQLDSLLNDSEGVQLFHDFLSTRFSSGHLLDFWFACKGFRSIIDGDDQLKLLQVAKAIYRTYIRTDAASSVPVNESTKREIRSTLTLYSHAHHKNVGCDKKLPVLRSLFDAAQMDIQNKLARSYFLDFLHSDAFRLVRQSLFNPEILANLQSTGLGSLKACTTQSRQKSEKQLVSDSPNQAANRIGDLNETFSAFGHSASHSSASRNFEDPRNVSKPHCADVLQRQLAAILTVHRTLVAQGKGYLQVRMTLKHPNSQSWRGIGGSAKSRSRSLFLWPEDSERNGQPRILKASVSAKGKTSEVKKDQAVLPASRSLNKSFASAGKAIEPPPHCQRFCGSGGGTVLLIAAHVVPVPPLIAFPPSRVRGLPPFTPSDACACVRP